MLLIFSAASTTITRFFPTGISFIVTEPIPFPEKSTEASFFSSALLPQYTVTVALLIEATSVARDSEFPVLIVIEPYLTVVFEVSFFCKFCKISIAAKSFLLSAILFAQEKNKNKTTVKNR